MLHSRLTQIEEVMMMFHQSMPDTVHRVPRDLPLADLKSAHHAKLIFLPCGWQNRLLDMVQLSGELRPQVGNAQVCRAVT